MKSSELKVKRKSMNMEVISDSARKVLNKHVKERRREYKDAGGMGLLSRQSIVSDYITNGGYNGHKKRVKRTTGNSKKKVR